MKTIKKLISKFFIFVINILKDVLSCMRDEFEVRNQVEIEKIKATKEILIATGNGIKEILIAVGNTVKDDCGNVLMNMFNASNKRQLYDRCLPTLGILILSIILSRKGIFDSDKNILNRGE